MLRVFDSVTGHEGSSGVFPPLNITQDNDSYYVRAELPGIKTADLSITALRNRVTIAGRREISREGEKVSYHRKERAEGEFSRTITLPGDVAADKVEARYTDGVLELTLPKAEESKPRQIAVTVS